MDLTFDSHQVELRSSVRAMLERECPMSLVRELVETRLSRTGSIATGPTGGEAGSEHLVANLWKQMVALDWPSLAIGEEYGGLGLGPVDQAVVLEELGRAVVPGPFLPTTTQFAPLVAEAGNEEQKQRFLGAVAAGSATGTFAVVDDARSWSPASVSMVAKPDGDGFVLDGIKHHVIEAAAVDEIAVAARLDGTSGEDGITLVVVPSGWARITQIPGFDASRQLATVELDSVRVDRERVLGSPGVGGSALRRALEVATTGLALEMLGTCQAIFDIALDYAKSRHQFGVPIGSFQAVKHRFADMLVTLERARATAYFAAAAIAEDEARRSLATSMAKAAAGDCQRHLAQEGIQCLGGIGYTWEHDMHLYVKRAKSGGLLLGTANEHRVLIANQLGLVPKARA